MRRNGLKRFLSLTGFTVIEFMIAMAILLMALGGISLVYLSGERLMYSGVNQLDVQRKAQTVGERITRFIRPAYSVTLINDGYGIQIQEPLNREKTQFVYKNLYFHDYSLYYDSDINDGNPPGEIVNDVFITDDPLFQIVGDLVYVNFGLESGYLHGPSYPVETGLTVKMRNAED